MMRSLRSRLIVGMLAGMAVLLVVASVTIYAVQRRQLYRAFDDTLLSSANALGLLLHPGPFGMFFDLRGFERLPPDRFRQGALFQFWSDEPMHLPRRWDDPNSAERGEDLLRGWLDGRPPWGRGFSDEGPWRERGFGDEGGPDGPRLGPESWWPTGSEEWLANAPVEYGGDAFVVRARTLGGVDLPRLKASPGRPHFENMTLPAGGPGRAVGLQQELMVGEPELRRSVPANVTMVVAASTVEVEQQLGFLAMLLAATAVGTMAVSGGVAWLVVSRGLRPLDALARKMATMDETGLKERIADRGGPREIEPVVKQLNGLLGRLDEAFERERVLTADVAHELRTPVAEIRAIAEITLCRPRGPEEYRQAFGETLDAVRTLQGLIEKLLVLARLEAGQMKADMQAADLKPRIVEHWAQVRDGAERRGVTFTDDCPAGAAVRADPELLDVVLTNALSNAAAYVSDRGRVTVGYRSVGGRGELSVANTGCELSAADAACVFARFWRADTSRSKSGLNCGLGLTLVRRAMEAMGGQAEARVTSDQCFVLVLTFDAAEPSGGD